MIEEFETAGDAPLFQVIQCVHGQPGEKYHHGAGHYDLIDNRAHTRVIKERGLPGFHPTFGYGHHTPRCLTIAQS